MSRFLIRWNGECWYVWDTRDDVEAASFPSLLEAEAYVIERSERSES